MPELKLKLRKPGKPPLLLLNQIRYAILGREVDKGWLFKLFVYLILIDTAFIYLRPILHMLATMVMNADDMLDPSVVWFPRTLYLGNLQQAWSWLNYPKALLISIGLSVSVSVLQTFSCAVAGYAFARLNIPFKRLLFFFLLLTFIIPIQVTVLPDIIYARRLGMLNTIFPIVLPAVFGLGLKGSLFVIIYRQFFSTQPKELEEAARIDGANVFKIFYKVMLPLAKPAILVVFLFSFIWTWNDFYLPGIYLANMTTPPLSLGIQHMESMMRQSGATVSGDAVGMATSFLIMVPPMILFIFTQRWFIEGVERTGLVE